MQRTFRFTAATLALGAVVTVLAPLLVAGLPDGHDVSWHTAWLTGFLDALDSGVAFPQWLLPANDGLGSPVFYLYPPLPYYPGAAIAAALGGASAVPVGLAGAALLSFAVGSAGVYGTLRHVVPPTAAAAGAAAYAILPYHVFIDTYYRFAYAELWGMALAPVVAYGAAVTLAGQRWGVAVLAAATAALLMSHPPSALIILPAVAGAGGLQALTLRRWRHSIRLGLGFALGGGLAAPYIATTFGYAAYTMRDRALYRYRVDDHFLVPDYVNLLFADIPHHFPLTLILATGATTLAATGAGVILLRSHRRTAQYRGAATLALTLALVLLMTSGSAPIWHHFPLLAKIQFPWRLNILLALLAAFAVGLAAAELDRRATALSGPMLRRALTTLGAAVGLATVSTGAITATHFDTLSSEALTAIQANLHDPPEYRLGIDPAPSMFDGRRVRTLSGKGEARVEAWSPRRIVLATRAQTSLHLAVWQYAFPTWHARLDGDGGWRPAQMAPVRTELPDRGYRLGEAITFGFLGRSAAIRDGGWHMPESDGRTWTKGKAAHLRFPLTAKPPERLTLLLTGHPFLAPPEVPGQRVRVRVNGQLVGRLQLTSRRPSTYAVVFRVPPGAGRTIRVTLATPDAVAPAAVTDSSDSRVIGVKIRRVRLVSGAAPAHPGGLPEERELGAQLRKHGQDAARPSPGVPHRVTRFNLLGLHVPAGEHRIVLRQRARPVERAGQIIGAMAMLGLLGVTVLPRRRGGRQVKVEWDRLVRRNDT